MPEKGISFTIQMTIIVRYLVQKFNKIWISHFSLQLVANEIFEYQLKKWKIEGLWEEELTQSCRQNIFQLKC